MKFLSTEEGKVGGLAGANILLAASQPWISDIESVLRITLLVGQIAVAALTAMYVYRKVRNNK